MKILITGGSGLLGKYLLQTAPETHKLALTWNKNFTVKVPGSDLWYKLDVRNRSEIFEVFDIFRPNAVIHCAAIGGVDYAEQHYQEVFDINVGGTQHLIDAANGYKAHFVYISTNAVFSGKTPPYDEKSALEPINAYGSIKRQAERVVRDTANKWLIVRPFLLYGWPYTGGRNNWAKAIIDKIQMAQSGYRLVDDTQWMPTYALECAKTLWRLLLKNEQVYNVAAPERCTLYEFGLKVCDVFGLEKALLKPVESMYFSNAAKRPKDTTYDLVKLTREGIMLSDIKTGLEKMKAENEL